MFVRGLRPEIQHDELHEFFQKHFGPVASAKVSIAIQKDEHANYHTASNGYGFVNFVNAEDAERAVSTLRVPFSESSETEAEGDKSERARRALAFLGEAVSVEQFARKDQRVPPERVFNNLYVKNLPPDFREEQLRKLFG